jgi:LysM repeat protein
VLAELGPVALPPLIYDEGIAVADAESPGSEFPPEMAEPTVLASAIPAMDESIAVSKVCEVAKGDTPSKIARREWNSADPRLAALLVEANPKVRERKGVILAGEQLVVPSAAVVQRVLSGTSPQVALAATSGTGAGVQAAAPATADVQWYTIQRNDTLANIAKRFLKDPQRWREILALNRALDPRKISPGMRIKLPPALRLAQG